MEEFVNGDRFESTSDFFLNSLYRDKEFMDVTLICENGKQLQAHRVILSSTSPILKNILQMNNQQNSVVYFRGVTFQDLQALIKFIYLGKVELEHHSVASFLSLASDLLISGISKRNHQSEADAPVTSLAEKQQIPMVVIKLEQTYEKIIDPMEKPDMTDNSTAAAMDNINNIDYNIDKIVELNKTFKLANAVHVEGDMENNEHSQKKYIESKANFGKEEITLKEEQFLSIVNMKEKYEISGDENLSKLGSFKKSESGTFICPLCNFTTEKRKQLFAHKLFVHINLKLGCDVCEKTFSDLRSLKKHKKTTHMGVRYQCNNCEKTTTTAFHLANHTKQYHSS